MVRKLLNLFLAVVILSCPLRCQLGWSGCCCGAERLTQTEMIECCCDPAQDQSPCPLPEMPCEKCKCICSGATLPDHFDVDWTIQSQPLCESPQPVVVQPPYSLISDLRPPKYHAEVLSANIGRILRCLYNSLVI